MIRERCSILALWHVLCMQATQKCMSLVTKGTTESVDTLTIGRTSQNLFSTISESQNLPPNTADILVEVSLETALPLSSHIILYNFVKNESGFQNIKIEFVVHLGKKCLLNYRVKDKLIFHYNQVVPNFCFIWFFVYAFQKVAHVCTLKLVT